MNGIARRDWLRGGAIVLGASALSSSAADDAGPSTVRLALVTDVHHAHLETKGTRHYRDSLAKLRAMVEECNACAPDAAVCLGDMIDSGDGSVESERQNLVEVHEVWSRLACPRHHVFGNHCVDMLTKEEFADVMGCRTGHYHADLGDWRLVFLDGCYRQDGVPYSRKQFKWNDSFVPPDQLEWLREILDGGPPHAAVFVHQRLDGKTKDHGVANHEAVRAVLAGSCRVRAVFAGHSHQNEVIGVDGIPHVVLRALIEDAGPENNAYGFLSLLPDGSWSLDGRHRQRSVAEV